MHAPRQQQACLAYERTESGIMNACVDRLECRCDGAYDKCVSVYIYIYMCVCLQSSGCLCVDLKHNGFDASKKTTAYVTLC